MSALVTRVSPHGAKWHAAFVTAVITACSFADMARAQDVPQFSIGAWRGSAGQSDDGTVKGCVASSLFSNGDRLRIFLLANLRMMISITGTDGRPPWVPANATGPVRAWVDDEPEFGAAGTVDSDGLDLPIGSIQEKNGASIFRRIGEGRTLNVTAGSVTRRYALRGTYGTLAELVGCALKVRDGEVAFPPKPSSPPVAVTSPTPVQPAPVAQRTPPERVNANETAGLRD